MSQSMLNFVFLDALNSVIPDHNFLFPEYEIVREPEEIDALNINETEQEDVDKNKAASTGNI